MPHNIFYRDTVTGGQFPDSVAYTCREPQHVLISSVKQLVTCLLCSKEGRKTLLAIANECENIRQELTEANSVDLEKVVSTFIGAMSKKENFPVIIADDVFATKTLGRLSKDKGILGGEVRFQDFEILINRPRVEQMVEAHRTGNPELSVYQVQLACTILRCMGQIFWEYLTYSMNNLPPVNGATPFQDMIERAGVKLESGIFGSHIDWYKNPDLGLNDPQPGQPFRADIDTEGRVTSSWALVDMSYIHKLAGREYVYPAVAVDPIIALGDREPLFPLSMV